jgi:Zn-finger nucleic acid-binding protein
MPIKPKPFVYVCPSCEWSKAVSPKSDALMPGEYYDCCPTCGTNPLKREEINILAELKIGLLKKILKL